MGGRDVGMARPKVLEVLAAIQAPPRDVTERRRYPPTGLQSCNLCLVLHRDLLALKTKLRVLFPPWTLWAPRAAWESCCAPQLPGCGFWRKASSGFS